MQNLKNSTSTNPEVELFLKESNAIEQVYNEDSLGQAKKAWDFLIAQPKLTHEVIKEVHRILMAHQDISENQKGYYRYCDVWIGGHKAPNPLLIKGMMETWLVLGEKIKTSKWPDEWIKQMHIQYETIHPFVDGNGRTGRMFLNYQRLKAGYPLLIIYCDQRFKYYEWFR